MSNTVEIILFSIVIGIGCTFFGAAIVLAIQFHYRRNPSVYINQYNAHPTINYVIPQQPPWPESAHLYLTTDWQKSTSSLTSAASEQRRMWFKQVKNPFQKSGLPVIPEPHHCPLNHHQFHQLYPLCCLIPLSLTPLQTLPNDFTDSRWSRAASEGPSTPYPVSATDDNARNVNTAEPHCFWPRWPLGFYYTQHLHSSQRTDPWAPIQPILSTQVSSNGTTQYPAPHEGESPMKEGTHPLSGHLLSDLHGDRSTSIMREQLSAPGSLRHPDLGDGQAGKQCQYWETPPWSVPQQSSQREEPRNHPSPHHDTPPWALP